MTGSNRASGLKALILVFVLAGSVIASTGFAAAAAAANTPTITAGGDVTVSEDSSATVSVDITAPDNPVDNGTVEMRVLANGSEVQVQQKTVSIDANTTKTVNYSIDASEFDEGDYTVEYSLVGLENATATSNLTVAATDSVSIESDTAYMRSAENQTTFNVSIEAGSDGFDSEPVTVTVINAADGETSFQRTVQNVTLAAGEEASLQVTLNRSEFGMTGAHTVRVAAGSAQDSATINLESVVFGGGGGGSGENGVDPLVIVAGAVVVLALVGGAIIEE